MRTLPVCLLVGILSCPTVVCAEPVRPRPIPAAGSVAQSVKDRESEAVSFASIYPGAEVVWQIGSLDNSSGEFPPRIVDIQDKKEWLFTVGKDDAATRFPASIGGQKLRIRAETILVRFSVDAEGDYTFVLALADGKNLWNCLEILLDDHVLHEYAAEGNSPAIEHDSFFRFAEPLHLSRGEHTIALKYKNARSAYEWLVFDAMALLKGTHGAVYRAEEFARHPLRRQRVWCEPIYHRPNTREAMGVSSISGPDFSLELALPDGRYDLELGFSETIHRSIQVPLLKGAGERLFDVYVNGKKVLADYDIIKASGGARLSTERVAAVASDGGITLRFVGKKQMARISRVRVLQGGKVIRAYEFIGAPLKKRRWSLADNCFASPTNLVPNPGFEWVDGEGNVQSWHLLHEKGKVQHCTGEAREGKACLRLQGGQPGSIRADTMGLVCADKPYALSVWVKTTGDCRVRPKLYWCRWHVQYRKDQIERFKEIKRRMQTEFVGVTPGEWQAAPQGWRKITLTAVPPHGSDCAGYGLDWEGGDGHVLVDDVLFDGLGALPVELMMSQGGYDTRGLKRAVVFTQSDCGGAGEFVVRTASNDPVKRGKLTPVGRCPWQYPDEGLTIAASRWNRHVWTADFTDIAEPGRYNLEVLLQDGQSQRSPVFSITTGKYRDVARHVITRYFPVIRCGADVPGWHPPCHTDDADILKGGKRQGHKAVSGGWHDAGDNNVFLFNVANCALAMTHHNQELATHTPVLDEACWGLDHLVRCQFDDGSFANRITGHPDSCPIIRPDKATDGDPATPDNRVCAAGGLYLEPTLAAVAGLFKSATQLDTTDPERARTYRDAAKRGLAYWERRGALDGAFTSPYKILIGLDTEREMPKERYEEWVTRSVATVTGALEDGSALTRWPVGGRFQFIYAYALLEFVKRKPADPQADRARKALRAFFDRTMVPAAEGSPFGQMQELRADRRRFAETYHSYDISYKYFAAFALAYAAEVLNERRYLAVAEAQVQWGLGLNPANICAVAGQGWREQSSFNLGSNDFPGHENGQYPGATHHCIVAGSGVKRRVWPLYDHRIPQHFGVPVDFPVCGVLMDYPTFGMGAEPWIQHAAPFILACTQIESALATLK